MSPLSGCLKVVIASEECVCVCVYMQDFFSCCLVQELVISGQVEDGFLLENSVVFLPLILVFKMLRIKLGNSWCLFLSSISDVRLNYQGFCIKYPRNYVKGIRKILDSYTWNMFFLQMRKLLIKVMTDFTEGNQNLQVTLQKYISLYLVWICK